MTRTNNIQKKKYLKIKINGKKGIGLDLHKHPKQSEWMGIGFNQFTSMS